MHILVCCHRGYYAEPTGDSYEYVSFVRVLRELGHRVNHLDHVFLAGRDRDDWNDLFSAVVRGGGYDLVMILPYRDEFHPEALAEASKRTLTLAWNCDDDWRWGDYSSKWVNHYSYVVTTYRHIYEANRPQHANLRLSQWGCTGLDRGLDQAKDLGVSFVGQGYGSRFDQLRRLQQALGLVAFGRGVPQVRGLRERFVGRLANWLRWEPKSVNPELVDQQAVKTVWNRSRISYTPLEASTGGGLQIKARVFDMGLSGTMMLCNRNEPLHEFYEPDKEYVEYGNLEEAISKARFYLTHEADRRRIAEAYFRRTQAEHLWSHRFAKLFADIGLT